MDQIALIYHEYEITKDLHLPEVIQTYGLIDKENLYALVQEDINGTPLSEYLINHPLPNLTLFLKLAIQMTRILLEVHKRYIIHKDIKPANFIIDPETELEKLTDFDYSTKLLHEVQDIVPPAKLEGTLAYMAPEQTGRMNMNIDYRSDFYALGVTFYEMLTGKLPFPNKDPLELLYAHLANEVPEISNPQFDIPPMLTKVVQKIMEKNPSQRYQSATGLLADLERCQNELQKTGKIDTFVLGEHDVLDRLNLSQKLYGREEETKILLSAYDRVSQGAVEALMVCGYSGIGKTMLINEVHKPMVKQKGYFISGKFDQLQRNTPYTAMTQAFNQLARQILAEPKSRFEKLKNNILEAVGDLGQIIVELAPEMELVIGIQPALEKLPPEESQNRMMTYFSRFMETISSKEHPLVIFIDDLQWIDSGSLFLLRALLENSKLSYVLFIGAYRDNEMDENHPLRTYFKKIEAKGNRIQFLPLGPPKEEDFEALFEDSFHQDKKSIKPLVELIYKRTSGNPFFYKQVINGLYKEKLLFFDYEMKQWNWNLDMIQALKITDNVIDLMVNKLNELPEETKIIIQYAACIGNQFKLDTLALIAEKSSGEIGQQLWPALVSELILSSKLTYKLAEALAKESLANILSKDISYHFIHDKVQQAAYESMSLSERQKTHLKMACLLLNKDPDVASKEQLFIVTDHFNEAHALLSQTERIKVVELNYRAGTEAQNANSYQSMLNYFDSALNLMDESWWKNHYDLIFSVSRDRAMALYLLNDLDRSQIETEKLFSQCKTNLDKASLYRIMLLIYYRKSDFENAINTACTALGLLGVELTPEIAKPKLLFKVFLLQFKIGRLRLDKLDTELKSLQNPSIEMAFEIMSESFFLFFEKGTESFVNLTVTAMNVLLKYGMPNSAGFWLMAYALVELNLFSRGGLSLQISNLSKKFFERNPHKYSQCQAYMWIGMFITPLYFTFELAMKERDFAVQLARESGNIFMESIAVAVGTFIAMSVGDSLEKPMKIAKQSSDLCMERGIVYHAYNFEVYYLIFKNLLEGELRSEDRLKALEDSILESDSLQIIATTLKYKSFYYYFAESNTKSLEYTLRWHEYEDKVRFDSFSTEVKTVNAILIANLLPETKGFLKLRLRRLFNKILKFVKWEASVNPVNYLHHYLFLKAANARLKGNTKEALLDLDKAIENAKKSNFYLWIALGNELAAELFIQQSQPRAAIDYIREAHYYYRRYGMMMKVQLLEKRYPNCFIQQINTPSAETSDMVISSIALSGTIAASGGLNSASIDFLSLMKSSQAISSEIELDKLLNKLLDVLLQSAGAHRVLLLQNEKDSWYVEAEGSSSEKHVSLAHTETVDKRHDLPLTLIRYVERAKESVLIQTPQEVDEHAQTDEYIRTSHPQSMLVIPVFYHGDLQSILYLENSSVSMAFKNEHVHILQLLSSQAAISLQNARLYYQATHDALTGLANRNLLYHVFELTTNKTNTTQTSIAIMLFDLDYFKTINDKLGHFVGDKVLIHIAILIKMCIGKENLAVRLGGDEFVAMMEYHDVQEVTHAAEIFLQKLKEPVMIEGHELILSSSIGISLYLHDGETINDLLKQADKALYLVKAKGKNQFQLYTTT